MKTSLFTEAWEQSIWKHPAHQAMFQEQLIPFSSFPEEQTDAFTPVGQNQPENNIKALLQGKKS